MYQVLTILSMPQYANSYRFLTTINNKQLQQIYEMRNHELAL